MTDEMGTFRVEVAIENPMHPRPARRLKIAAALVDTGAEFGWFPGHMLDELGIKRRMLLQFRQADGSVLERWLGDVRIYVAGTEAIDHVVFGEPNDMVLLGAHSLEGLNRRVDPVSRRLVDAGPVPAAALA